QGDASTMTVGIGALSCRQRAPIWAEREHMCALELGRLGLELRWLGQDGGAPQMRAARHIPYVQTRISDRGDHSPVRNQCSACPKDGVVGKDTVLLLRLGVPDADSTPGKCHH